MVICVFPHKISYKRPVIRSCTTVGMLYKPFRGLMGSLPPLLYFLTTSEKKKEEATVNRAILCSQHRTLPFPLYRPLDASAWCALGTAHSEGAQKVRLDSPSRSDTFSLLPRDREVQRGSLVGPDREVQRGGLVGSAWYVRHILVRIASHFWRLR